MADLPDGFVLDAPAPSAGGTGLPDGFQIDPDPAKSSPLSDEDLLKQIYRASVSGATNIANAPARVIDGAINLVGGHSNIGDTAEDLENSALGGYPADRSSFIGRLSHGLPSALAGGELLAPVGEAVSGATSSPLISSIGDTLQNLNPTTVKGLAGVTGALGSSDAAGDASKGTALEPLARLAGGVAGAVVPESIGSAIESVANPVLSEGALAARRQGIELPPATASGNFLLNKAQDFAAGAVIPNSGLKSSLQNVSESIKNRLNDILDEIHPVSDPKEAAALNQRNYNAFNEHPDAQAFVTPTNALAKTDEVLKNLNTDYTDPATGKTVNMSTEAPNDYTTLQKELKSFKDKLTRDDGTTVQVPAGILAQRVKEMNNLFDSKGVGSMLNPIAAATKEDLSPESSYGQTNPEGAALYQKATTDASNNFRRQTVEAAFNKLIDPKTDQFNFKKAPSILNPDTKQGAKVFNAAGDLAPDLEDISSISKLASKSKSVVNPDLHNGRLYDVAAGILGGATGAEHGDPLTRILVGLGSVGGVEAGRYGLGSVMNNPSIVNGINGFSPAASVPDVMRDAFIASLVNGKSTK